MNVYTKGGDKGSTSIIGGSRVSKNDSRVAAYGSIDEVNSWIGVIIAELNPEFKDLKEQLTQIQILLFDCGTDFATPEGTRDYVITQASVDQLEKLIDSYSEKLPPLEKFILPGGHLTASHLQVARTVARRAEREAAQLIVEKVPVNMHAFQVLNRLSDLFFVLARYINHSYSVEEPTYDRAGRVFH